MVTRANGRSKLMCAFTPAAADGSGRASGPRIRSNRHDHAFGVPGLDVGPQPHRVEVAGGELDVQPGQEGRVGETVVVQAVQHAAGDGQVELVEVGQRAARLQRRQPDQQILELGEVVDHRRHVGGVVGEQVDDVPVHGPPDRFGHLSSMVVRGTPVPPVDDAQPSSRRRSAGSVERRIPAHARATGIRRWVSRAGYAGRSRWPGPGYGPGACRRCATRAPRWSAR